jgi:hypothetical protein
MRRRDAPAGTTRPPALATVDSSFRSIGEAGNRPMGLGHHQHVNVKGMMMLPDAINIDILEFDNVSLDVCDGYTAALRTRLNSDARLLSSEFLDQPKV